MTVRKEIAAAIGVTARIAIAESLCKMALSKDAKREAFEALAEAYASVDGGFSTVSFPSPGVMRAESEASEAISFADLREEYRTFCREGLSKDLEHSIEGKVFKSMRDAVDFFPHEPECE